MRITNNIIRENALTNMRRGLQQMETAQQQVGTGLKLRRASDDPAAAATTMTARSSLRALESYRAAIGTATVRARTEETVLDQLTDLLSRAKELAIAHGTVTPDAESRDKGRIEVEHLLRQAVSLANTHVDGNYLFGGNRSNVQPFALDESGATLDFTSSNPTGNLQVEISSGQLAVTNRNGSEIFGDVSDGVLASIRDLAQALHANSQDEVGSSLTGIDDAFATVQGFLADAGARFNQMEITTANLDAMEVSLLTLKSSLEEVDIERAVTELVGRQTAYQAAMLATSKVMGLTITDYLR